MPFVELKNSPHADGVRSVRIHYRDVGSGPPQVFLHGGWGYGVYPIERQIEEFAGEFRLVIPERSGYGQSLDRRDLLLSRPTPIDFHRRAAEETLLVLDALGIERAVFWGHSDGSVIAAKIGLLAPERCEQLILEAFHFYCDKPGSHNFFQRYAHHPEEVSEKLRGLLAADHGDRWPTVIQRNCRVWLELAELGSRESVDLYDGRLGELRVPSTFVHGKHDPRTEPDEMERVRAALPGAVIRFIESGRHSPHSEGAWREFNDALREIFSRK